MKTNRILLEKVREDLDSEAWMTMVQSYQPLIRKWVQRFDETSNDINDITQDVLCTVVKELPKFKHNGRTGAFRNWLRTITVNQIRTNWRKQKRDPLVGGDQADHLLQQLTDPTSDLSKKWNSDHDQHVFEQMLEMLKAEFNLKTMIAFHRHVVGSEPADRVAEDLGVSVSQIYKCKFRVMSRLKRMAKSLERSGLDSFVGPLKSEPIECAKKS